MKGPWAIRGGLALALSLGLGCQSDDVFLEAPEVPGAGSYLFALEQPPNLSIIAAKADASDVSIEPADWYRPEEPLDVTRLALAESLEDLGVSAGPLRPSPAPNRPLRDFIPLETGVVSLDSGGGHRVLREGEASAAVLDFALPRVTNCPRLEYADPLTAGVPLEALALDETRTVALSLDEVFVFHVDGTIQRWPMPPGERGTALCLSDTGRPWVGTSSAARPLDLELGVLDSPAITHRLPDWPVGIMVNESEGAPEVWLVSREAEVLRYHGEPVEVELAHQMSRNVVRVGELGSFSSTSARFVRLSGNDFLLAGEDIGLLLEYRGGVFRERLADARNRGFGGVVRRADGTVIVSETLTGAIYLYDRGTVDPIASGVTEISGLALGDDDQLVFVTLLGISGVEFLDQRECPNESSGSWRVLRTLAPLGEAYLVGGDHAVQLGSFGLLRLR